MDGPDEGITEAPSLRQLRLWAEGYGCSVFDPFLAELDSLRALEQLRLRLIAAERQREDVLREVVALEVEIFNGRRQAGGVSAAAILLAELEAAQRGSHIT